MPKVLCICEKGNSRSVALAYLLKRRGQEALAIGFVPTSLDTRRLLYAWAERIILLEPAFEAQLRLELRPADAGKVRLYPVGEDVWFRGYKRDLLSRLEVYLALDNL